MPRPRFLKLDPERRQAILEAATAEFAQSGFEGASYNRIIEQAGLSKGAMYYYFDDKLDLYVTVLEGLHTQMMEIWGIDDDWEPEGEFWVAMAEMGHRGWSFAMEHPELAALAKTLQSFPKKARKEGRLGEIFTVWNALLIKLLTHGRERGEVRTDVPISLLVDLVMALDECIDMWLLDHSDELSGSPDEIVALVMGFYRRVLDP